MDRQGRLKEILADTSLRLADFPYRLCGHCGEVIGGEAPQNYGPPFPFSQITQCEHCGKWNLSGYDGKGFIWTPMKRKPKLG